ncbi:hypothetical protein B9Q08_02415 [Candidatus Marsarchaeota G2 archaeon ECH_B_SAG-M15]|uniref:Uncharacterized protein n=1 Tax=Candidatus Marsarchaeota G2 archaeon ECH_B_SAG-M15 TaxID=1978162 RepID=A0A2R6AZ64_9ARCH|nr:MAG: hypothetical protein B9Q08_02415 [Candidatus Marsarchaeota G2 archaeon ECH_B_SAG-M15]
MGGQGGEGCGGRGLDQAWRLRRRALGWRRIVGTSPPAGTRQQVGQQGGEEQQCRVLELGSEGARRGVKRVERGERGGRKRETRGQRQGL